MKYIIIFLMIVIVGCSSNPMIKQAEMQHDAIESLVKEDRIIGDSLPDWVNKSGIENGMVYVVGQAEFNVDKSPLYVRKAATMDAEVKLISDAPSDVRILTQNVLSGIGVDSSEFHQIQTKLQTVIGLNGIKINQEKMTCRKIVRYGSMSAYVVRSCWVQASVPLNKLMKAYQRTLQMKFGEYKARQFGKLADKELNRIMNGGKDEKPNTVINVVPRERGDGRRLSSKQTHEIQEQQQSITSNSQRQKLY